jgi:integrase
MAIRERNGRWYAYWNEPLTGRRREKWFGRGPEAEAAARAFDAARARPGRGRPPAPGGHVGPTLAELAEDYIMRPKFNPNSRACLAWRLSANILPALGHRPANSITHADLDAYIDERRRPRVVSNHKQPRVVHLSTVRREISDILAILSWAQRRRRIPVNPVAGYEKPGADDARIVPPTEDEAAAILQAAQDHLRRAIVLSWYTGLRPGAVELLRLTWAAWRRESGWLRVVSAAKGGVPIRDVPVHPGLAEQLAAWHEADGHDAGPIIRYRGRPIKSLKRAWHGALRRAGIDRRLRPYDLRHHFITRLLAAGADIKTLAEIVGSSPETLRRHYQHVTSRQRRQTIALAPALPTYNVGRNDLGPPKTGGPK